MRRSGSVRDRQDGTGTETERPQLTDGELLGSVSPSQLAEDTRFELVRVETPLRPRLPLIAAR